MDLPLDVIWPYIAAAAVIGILAGVIAETRAARRPPDGDARGRR